jgi:uncharacterized protein (DUF433 family)
MTTLTTSATRKTMASPVSIRLPEPTAGKIRTLAAIERRSIAEMLRLLAEEALKLREFPEITFTDGPTGRRATFIQGPDVWEVLEPYVLANRDWQALRESYPELDEAVLYAAVRYYEAYPDEVDARIALNQAE